jgi:hypothetical protein
MDTTTDTILSHVRSVKAHETPVPESLVPVLVSIFIGAFLFGIALFAMGTHN